MEFRTNGRGQLVTPELREAAADSLSKFPNLAVTRNGNSPRKVTCGWRNRNADAREYTTENEGREDGG
jgi:hypothetical protein